MRKALIVVFGLVLASVVGVVIFVICTSVKSSVSKTAQTPNIEQAQTQRQPMKPDISNIETTSSSNVAPPSPVPAQDIPQELKGVTDDPAVVKFLSSRRLQEVGEVRSTKSQNQQLWVNGRMVFEAMVIKNVRTISQDGTIALAAVTDESVPATSGHDIDLSERPSSIWIVDIDGNKRRVSSPTIDASKPLIAPSGNVVAFTGSQIGAGGSPPSVQLFVVSIKGGSTRSFGANQRLDDYSITAVEWSEGEKVVKVIEDYGETGGHMTMREIHVD